jgi:hypothetical protein
VPLLDKICDGPYSAGMRKSEPDWGLGSGMIPIAVRVTKHRSG